MNTARWRRAKPATWSTSTATPTKLIEIVEIGKALLLMTRGSLTTFSIANDVAKLFRHHPGDVCRLLCRAGQTAGPLQALNIMHLGDAAERHPVGHHLQRADHHPR